MKVRDAFNLEETQVDRIIEMAWEDRTPFDAIYTQFGLQEGDVIRLMREEMKRSSWKMWRERMHQLSTKHRAKRTFLVGRHKCATQKEISYNKVK